VVIASHHRRSAPESDTGDPTNVDILSISYTQTPKKVPVWVREAVPGDLGEHRTILKHASEQSTASSRSWWPSGLQLPLQLGTGLSKTEYRAMLLSTPSRVSDVLRPPATSVANLHRACAAWLAWLLRLPRLVIPPT